ncbi:MAG TPA: GntR family transcriptional regulator, partial [Planctomycetota bacterium]|nr:GntR family transcriptional regulator [Planctomycetota bacterium]
MDAIARSVPKYELLAGKVARQIQARSLLPGQPMPSVRSLMSEYHLSMGTVMKGLELLKAQGMVDRLPQRGYFVANTSSSKPRTRQIAFITQALSGDTSRYLAGFSQALDHQQYSLATYSSAHDQTLYQTIIEQVIRQQPAGIVLFAQLPETVCPMDPTSLAQCGIPIVSIGPRVRGLTCDRVCQNGSDSGKKLARHLLQRGCTDFAMLMYSCTA